MFFSTDAEDVVYAKCKLINNELERIHKTVHNHSNYEEAYIKMVSEFLKLVNNKEELK